MNEYYYLKLLPYKAELYAWCIERSNVNGDKLRAIAEIYREIYNYTKPINFSCRGCVDEFMRMTFNLFRAYENSISKQS